MHPGRAQICFARHLFSLLCEGRDQVIHRGTGLDNICTGLRRSSSGQLAPDLFGESDIPREHHSMEHRAIQVLLLQITL